MYQTGCITCADCQRRAGCTALSKAYTNQVDSLACNNALAAMASKFCNCRTCCRQTVPIAHSPLHHYPVWLYAKKWCAIFLYALLLFSEFVLELVYGFRPSGIRRITKRTILPDRHLFNIFALCPRGQWINKYFGGWFYFERMVAKVLLKLENRLGSKPTAGSKLGWWQLLFHRIRLLGLPSCFVRVFR